MQSRELIDLLTPPGLLERFNHQLHLFIATVELATEATRELAHIASKTIPLCFEDMPHLREPYGLQAPNRAQRRGRLAPVPCPHAWRGRSRRGNRWK